jgi:hypothetical protein
MIAGFLAGTMLAPPCGCADDRGDDRASMKGHGVQKTREKSP